MEKVKLTENNNYPPRTNKNWYFPYWRNLVVTKEPVVTVVEVCHEFDLILQTLDIWLSIQFYAKVKWYLLVLTQDKNRRMSCHNIKL